MAASTTDKLHKTGAATKTTLAAPGKALAATSINVVSTTNWPTDTQVTFAIRQIELVDGAYAEVAGTYAEFNGIVSGTTITNMGTPVYGSDQVYPAGTTTEVFIPVSSYAHNRMIDGILVGHNQTGTHKAFTESSIVPTAAIQDSAVTTAKIADSNVTTGKLADTAVTYAKTDGKIWWEEIGRTTLGTAGDTITVSSLPARKYLKVIISGAAASGTLEPSMSFNSDSSTNYTLRYSYNFGAGQSIGSQTSIGVTGDAVPSGQLLHAWAEITNISTSPKAVHLESVNTGVSGAPNGINVLSMYAKWVNTSSAISTVAVTNGGTGDFAIGSEIVVLGHN